MFGTVPEGIRNWLVSVFASAIKHSIRADDRALAVQWLGQSRDIVASDLRSVEKFRKLNELIDSRAALKVVARSVSESIANYRKSNLPLSLKIALPATLAALPLVGGQGAGIAAFGGALGVPVLLLIFLGATGITSIIEAIVTNPQARPHMADIIDVIINDERLRRTSAEMKAAMRQKPGDPVSHPMPASERELRQSLLDIDPFKFEQHIMSFFVRSGLEAWQTRASNDFGADGFAKHNDGLIVVQCKRNSTENKVGSPTVQQFKGVIEDHGAFRGYIVTTSAFTENAKMSANMSDKVILVDMDTLARWHKIAPTFD